MRGHHKTNKLDSNWRYGTAYIIETREHPNVPLVLLNADQCLPDNWEIIIFCSTDNHQYMKNNALAVTERKMTVRVLDSKINSIKDYNALLFSDTFWRQFETENLLGFQVDSWLNNNQSEVLSDIANYDYVGAPWSDRIQRRWDYIPSYGGNGGVCFSKRSARLKALEESNEPRTSKAPHKQVLNEDIWFSRAIKSVGGRLASRKNASEWFVESVYSPNPFAVHKPWCYVSENNYLSLLNELPGLNKLKLGCDKNSKPENYGTAYIVETREHPNLFLVLDNADRTLPVGWEVIVFCSTKNQNFCNQVAQKITGRTIKIELLKSSMASREDYNKLLLSMSFWQQFDNENLLCFQTDSLFNVNQKNQLTEICKYDYVGSPWSEVIRKSWDFIPSFGGNGGVCFSKRSMRIATLKNSKESLRDMAHNEDVWFSLAVKELNGRMPSLEQASKWFVESIYSPEPFAVHKPWLHIDEDRYQLLTQQIPELGQLKKGCTTTSQNVSKGEDVDYRSFLLRFARECMDADNFYQADLALQVCQGRYPSHPSAYNLQSVLAHKLGLYDRASHFVAKAIGRAPTFKRALENQKIIETAISQQSKVDEESSKQDSRYLLIHSWGSGLGFDLLYLLKQLMLAELTDRQPVIHWGVNSLYNDRPEQDCFIEYFESVSDIQVNELEEFHDDCYPSFWQERELTDHINRTRWRNTENDQLYKITGLYYLKRDENLVVGGEFTTIKTLLPWIPTNHRLYGLPVTDIYRDLMSKYIKPKAYLKDRANDFVNKAFKQRDFIAIHLRGTDKSREKQSADIASINQQLIGRLANFDFSLDIFVMTDDVRQITAMKQRFGERVKSIDVTRSTDDEQGVHYTANDKSKIAQEVLVDMLIAAQSAHFLGCGFSYLACCVSYLRKQSDSTTLLPYDVMTRFVDIPSPGRFGIE